MVMAFHFHQYLPSIAWTGWVGVEIFFVLSGFVISYSAMEATPESFFRARFVRLMPTIWLCASVSAISILIVHGMVPGLTRAYFNTLILWPTGPWIEGAYWTLPIEIIFYGLVWATLYKRPWLTLRIAIYSMGCASTVYWLWRVAAQFYPSNAVARIIDQIPYKIVELTPLGYGSYFAIGGLACTRFC
jgi:peptidoglycan/LPS O-acetylase OafA/YrhL